MKIQLESTITCPKCGHSSEEIMPTEACQWFYECASCGEVLKPLPGDCCVYCSYGTVACPPIQQGGSCCGYPGLRRQIHAQAARWDAVLILIEEAGSGVQLVQDLQHEHKLSVKGMVPKDDKATRLLSVSHLIEAGQIAVPAAAPWLAEFQREVTLFPAGKHDDQVDSLSQFLKWLAEPRIVPSITVLDGPRLPYGRLSLSCLERY